MKRVAFTPTTIQSSSPSGIIYCDDNGRICEITFAECQRNWVAFVSSSGEFQTTMPYPQTTTCVAWRDFFAKPPYIEFFTVPRTRFEFHQPQSWFEWLRFPTRRRWAAHFHELQYRIHELGCSSFDLG